MVTLEQVECDQREYNYLVSELETKKTFIAVKKWYEHPFSVEDEEMLKLALSICISHIGRLEVQLEKLMEYTF